MKAGLWQDKPATPQQQRLAFCRNAGRGRPAKRAGRVTQADLLLCLFRERREQGKPVELPEILRLGIAQFTARIFELRGRGFVIENELEHINGQVHSRYWLRHDPERDGVQ